MTKDKITHLRNVISFLIRTYTLYVDRAQSSQGAYNCIPRRWIWVEACTRRDAAFWLQQTTYALRVNFLSFFVGHVAHWLKPQMYSFKVNHTIGSDILVCIHVYPSHFIKCWDHVEKSFKENL
jgi:hypothetical protein